MRHPRRQGLPWLTSLTLQFPFVEAEVDPAKLWPTPALVGGSAHVRELAERVLEALASDDLSLASDRLLTLADEFPRELEEAVTLATAVEQLPASKQILGDADADSRRSSLKQEIYELVLRYITQVAIAERDEGPSPGAAESPDAAHNKSTSQHRSQQTLSDEASEPEESELTGDAAVVCDGLVWSIGNRLILDDVTLQFLPATVTAIVGRNGAGKTSLLRAISQSFQPTQGQIDYPTLRATSRTGGPIEDRIAFVPQRSEPYAGSLQEHLRLYAGLRGMVPRRQNREVEYVIVRFGLAEYRHARWDELTEGFRMRVELARSMLASPDILILDEPLGPLDAVSKRDYLRHLRELAASRRHLCVIISSHDLNIVRSIAGQLVLLDHGSVVFAGEPDGIAQVLTSNLFELGSPDPDDQVETALRPIRANATFKEGTLWYLETRLGTSACDVLQSLLLNEVRIDYFRDVSNSPERLMADPTRHPRSSRENA